MSFVNSAKQAQEEIIKQKDKEEKWKNMQSGKYNSLPEIDPTYGFPEKFDLNKFSKWNNQQKAIAATIDQAVEAFTPKPPPDNGDSWLDNILGAVRSAASTAKDALNGLLGGDSTTTPQTGNSAKPTVYSDWSPAAQQFGMDQATAYAEHMANTAHQREVADLRAAGLNPVLGVGSGASGVAGHVATSGSSAQKSLNGDFIVDAIGATAAVVTAILTKNPAYGYMAGNAVNAVGDMFTNGKK